MVMMAGDRAECRSVASSDDYINVIRYTNDFLKPVLRRRSCCGDFGGRI